MPQEYRAQWVKVWNSKWEESHDEGQAFATANGVIKTRKEEAYEAALSPQPTTPPQNLDVDAIKIDPLALTEKVSAASAGYLELPGAVKDAGCDVVSVEGGVSDEKGCCDLFAYQKGQPKEFRCGTCTHLAAKPQTKQAMSDCSNHSPYAAMLCGNMPVSAWDGKPTNRIPIATTGTWHRHGSQFSITDQDLDSIVENFQKRLNGQVVIDYEHASEHPEDAKGGAIPAAGWIHAVYKSQGAIAGQPKPILYAQVEWTPEAKGHINSGRYRFFSPALDWGFEDKRKGGSQGATLTSGALTNHPFLEELPPITAAEALADSPREALLLSEVGLMDVSDVHVPGPAKIVSDAQDIRPAVVSSDVQTSPQATDKSGTISVASEQTEANSEAAAPLAEELRAEGDKDHKSVGGQLVHRDQFLHVGDPDKKETWKLPVHDESHIRNAMSRFNQTEGLPNKSALAAKLARMAKAKGIDVSEFKKHLEDGFKECQEALAEVESLTEEVLAEAKHLETPMAKSALKKIEDGKHAGRFGRFDEKGKLLNLMPSGMAEEALQEFAAELDEGGWHSGDIIGMDKPAETPGQKKEADLNPRGNFLAEGDEPEEVEPDGDVDDKKVKASERASEKDAEETVEAQKLSDSELLGIVLYPDGHAKRGRINLSEASRQVTAGNITAADILRVQAAAEQVNEAISAEKFLPKQRRTLMGQAMSNPKAFSELVDSQPRLMLSTTRGLASRGADTDPGEVFQAKVQQHLDERRKVNPNYDYAQALREVTKQDPELWPSNAQSTIKEWQ